MRCARCAYSWTVSISDHSRYEPIDHEGEGGVGNRNMSGASMSGSANPFATLSGSSTITVTRSSGAHPTSALTASRIDSMRLAMSSVHASLSAV